MESTSGNLGVALAAMCRLHGLSFVAVVDPKTAGANLQILEALGARIEMVTRQDSQGGYLETRIARAKELADELPDAVWINQYANELNWLAHYHGAGEEIATAIDGPIDCLVAAVSTTGTILGVARRLRRDHPNLSVVAVDAVGSVIFGADAGPRELPGFGSSRVPELLCEAEIDDVVHVDDADSAHGCRRLAHEEGILAGGSSGAVIAAVERLLEPTGRPSRIVALLADRGDRYLDLVYNDDWLERVQVPIAA